MLGGAMGFRDRDSGAVTASQAIRIINSASSAATAHPAICIRRFQGRGGAKALGGPAPKARGGRVSGSGVGRGSVIASDMLCYLPDPVKRAIGRESCRERVCPYV